MMEIESVLNIKKNMTNSSDDFAFSASKYSENDFTSTSVGTIFASEVCTLNQIVRMDFCCQCANEAV